MFGATFFDSFKYAHKLFRRDKEGTMFDVIIIGAGVIGASIAREAAKYALNICVLEKESDVASGSSKANSGIVHAGHDAKPGTNKAKFNIAGQKMFEELSTTLKFPFRRCGSLVIAFDKQDLAALQALKARGEANGLTNLAIIDQKRLRELEPHINESVFAALHVPSGGIVCPYEMTIALAENAAENGVEFRLGCTVTNVQKKDDCFLVSTNQGVLHSKIVINAAGLYADAINNMISARKLTIIPRKGEYCLLDKTEGTLVNHTIFQLPSNKGKGILVTPTVDGNLLCGPTSVDIEDKINVATTREGLREVLEKAGLDLDAMPVGKIITAFTGLRAHSTENDFIIGEAPDVPGFINSAGIESPGLTSAPAIGVAVAELAAQLLCAKPNADFKAEREALPHIRHMTDAERDELIRQNPDYGKIICRCETVSKGEIVDALRSPLGVNTLDGIKRRTRAGMGRCQSGFCNMRLLDIVSEVCGISMTEVTKFGDGSNLLIEKNKTDFAGGLDDEG